jgi:putative transcriptional regulator
MSKVAKKPKKEDLNRLGEVLSKKKISQYRLHKDSNVSYALINNYVSNNRQPTLNTLFKLAEALGVNPKELINS